MTTKWTGHGHVRETGAKISVVIDANKASKAREIAQDWAHENALVYDGIEVEETSPNEGESA